MVPEEVDRPPYYPGISVVSGRQGRLSVQTIQISPLWSVTDEVDRPEHVQVGDNDDGTDDRTDKSRSSWCAHSQRLQRHPDRDKPIGADDDDQPRAEVERDQQQKHDRFTAGR